MSRIGKNPIQIPAGVQVTVENEFVKVKGPKGELSQHINAPIEIKVDGTVVTFKALDEERLTKSCWGLYRALVANMIAGVTAGFRKDLEIVGVGYRAAKKGNDLTINIGYSNPVEFKSPEGITLNVEDNVKISVVGADKALVGQVAADIRKIRKPEPYKGKGIKYAGEVIRRKAGKAAAKAA
jgi:large subunit ribosomal protein L6